MELWKTHLPRVCISVVAGVEKQANGYQEPSYLHNED